eukprot:6485607-Amphidinium_carterae.1
MPPPLYLRDVGGSWTTTSWPSCEMHRHHYGCSPTSKLSLHPDTLKTQQHRVTSPQWLQMYWCSHCLARQPALTSHFSACAELPPVRSSEWLLSTREFSETPEVKF